jgi:hypothetical protein
MKRILISCFVFIAAFNAVLLTAEETSTEGTSAEPVQQREQNPPPDDSPLRDLFPRGQALALDINARIIGQDQNVTWNESHRKITNHGQPVELKLVGANVVVVVKFTPYMRRNQKFIVAQGQIWMDIPNQGIRYQTSMQTIPVEFGEAIYFFPLGAFAENDADRIEVMVTLHPYDEN